MSTPWVRRELDYSSENMIIQMEQEIDAGRLASDIEYIKRDIGEIKDALAQGYVTQEEFKPVKALVYGVAGIILTAVIGAIVALVVK